MATATMTFDECQSAADRMFAYAVLVAQAATHLAKCGFFLRQVDGAIANLLSLVTADRVERLTPEQRSKLTVRLQETHGLLLGFLRSKEGQGMANTPWPVIPGLMANLESETADLGDVIENIISSSDETFLRLVGACTHSLGLSDEADTIAGIQS